MQHHTNLAEDNSYTAKERNKFVGWYNKWTEVWLSLKVLEIKWKKATKFETKVSETICVELTISKKQMVHTLYNRPPQNNNLKTFFEEINLSLSTIVNE